MLPHLLLKLVEDELDHNVVLHLQQFRRPLGDPGLQNIQLDLNENISNIHYWLRRGHCLALRHLQNCNSWRGVVETFLAGQHEYFLPVERGYLLHVNFLRQAFFKPHGVHKLLLLIRKSVVLVG